MRSTLAEAARHWPMIAASAGRYLNHDVFTSPGNDPSYILTSADPRINAVVVGPASADLLTEYLPEHTGFVMAQARGDHADDPVLTGRGYSIIGDWWWMACRRPIPPQPGDDRVRELHLPADEIAALQARCYPDTHVRAGDPSYRWWGYEAADGALAGIVATTDVRPDAPKTAGMHVSALGVDPDYRRQGIAAAMMSAVTKHGLRQGPVVHCGVWKRNEPALRVYRRLGFAEEHEVRGWQRD
ncbi:GNAT family N-acetyltransferase [Bowdeniella nasicola]|nr:GNAT family N-acetyltransferase [Bowdeniella nasicola]